ncbi:1918_t:CDS:2, partial [Entrophospora sp. SA101]
FLDAEDEDEFNFFLKRNEHEEFEDSEVTNVNENIDTFASTDIIEISDDIREENSTEESTSKFIPLVHRYNLHNAIVKLPHELNLLTELNPISIFMLFFTNEIFNQLVINTNLYAIDKDAGTGRDWYLLTVPELKI